MTANTFTISGHETKLLNEMLPIILNQLQAVRLTSLRRPVDGKGPLGTGEEQEEDHEALIFDETSKNETN